MLKWLNYPAYPWQFWLPMSGFIGGAIGGVIAGILFLIIRSLFFT